MRAYLSMVLWIFCFGCVQPKQNRSHSWVSVAVDSTVSKHPESEELIAPYRELIDEEMNRVLVQSDTIIYKVKPESPLSNLVADLSFERASLEAINQGFPQPDLCLLNFGGLRVSLPGGEIRVRKVFELMPFENELVIMELNPDSVQSLLKYLVQVGGQPVSNLKMSWTENGEISSLGFGDEELNPDKNYRVVTTDYLAAGGDQMSFFKNPVNRNDLNLKLRDAILDHFQTVGKSGGSLTPKMDGRLQTNE